jgi:uncharacterized protein YajQ (UPF0234 family)
VNCQSLEQLYSSKTDDELLALSADEGSLREEAKQILIRELQRRGLDAGRVEVKDTRISGTRRTNLKIPAVISFIVAIVLGIAAVGNFAQDHSRREQAVQSAISADADRYKSAEHTDEILGFIAIEFFIASLVMFSQAKHQPSIQ